MRVFCFLVAVSFLLLGCETVDYHASAVPETYQGETATLHDTYQKFGKREGWIYYVESVNGQHLENAGRKTVEVNEKAGVKNHLALISAFREVPANEVEVTLVTRRHRVMPMEALLGSASGTDLFHETLTFSPEPGEHYLVKGNIFARGASAWIEDFNGRVVSEVVGTFPIDTPETIRSSLNMSPRERRFFDLSAGESRELVEKKLGEPDREIRNKGTHSPAGMDQIKLMYEGLGTIDFDVYEGSSFLANISPNRKIDDPVDLVKFLRVGSISARSDRAKILYRTDKPIETEALDDLAIQLWNNRYMDQEYIEDIQAWICKTLGSKGGGRYNEFLSELASITFSRKVEGYARKWIADGVDSDVTQFSIQDASG